MSSSSRTGLLAAGRSDGQLSDWARNELLVLSTLLDPVEDRATVDPTIPEPDPTDGSGSTPPEPTPMTM